MIASNNLFLVSVLVIIFVIVIISTRHNRRVMNISPTNRIAATHFVRLIRKGVMNTNMLYETDLRLNNTSLILNSHIQSFDPNYIQINLFIKINKCVISVTSIFHTSVYYTIVANCFTTIGNVIC